VTQSTDADDSDFLGRRSGSVFLQGRVDGDTSAHHGGGDIRRETFRYRDGEAGGDTSVVAVTTLRSVSTNVSGVICSDKSTFASAVWLLVVTTVLALQARARLSANTNTVANLQQNFLIL